MSEIEALESLRNLHINDTYHGERLSVIITKAIEAFEEKQEREKGCQYCKDEKRIPASGNAGIRIPQSRSIPQISIEGDSLEGHSYSTAFKINCCPMCGRKLGENDG